MVILRVFVCFLYIIEKNAMVNFNISNLKKKKNNIKSSWILCILLQIQKINKQQEIFRNDKLINNYF
jgi:hypothetical protein